MTTQKDLFPETSTSSQRATPASRSALRESKKRRKTLATSGRQSHSLLHKRDPLSAYLKTCMVTLPWDSTRCCLTWKPKATPQGRLYFQLAVSMPPTEETDSGSAQSLWATPLAQEAKHGAPTEWELTTDHVATKNSLRVQVAKQERVLWPTPTAMTGGDNPAPSHFKKGKGRHGWNLGAAVKASMWPTPTCQDGGKATKKWRDNNQNNLTAVVFTPEMWPTPSASNAKMAPQNRYYGSPTYRANLDEAVRTHSEDQHLNPDWVEWLMGYPSGWLSEGGEPDTSRAVIGEPWSEDPGERTCASFPGRPARLKALGNAIVPQIAHMLGTAIVEELDKQEINNDRATNDASPVSGT